MVTLTPKIRHKMVFDVHKWCSMDNVDIRLVCCYLFEIGGKCNFPIRIPCVPIRTNSPQNRIA